MTEKNFSAIIFDTEIEAKNWDWHHNKLKGSISKYTYNRVPLNSTTTLTKAEYAELLGIPATIETEEGKSITNPQYVSLPNTITEHKYAAIVGDNLAVRDENGNITHHACPYCGEEFDVVEITDDMVYKLDGEF